MRIIHSKKITAAVSDLCIQANIVLRKDVLASLKAALKKETDSRAKKILEAIIQNALIARREKSAICQDTGLPIVFVELGRDLKINGDLKKAIQKGVELGYKKGYLRNSIISDPLSKRVSPGYVPSVIHFDLVKGNKLRLTVLPKGFGCENKTQLRMFLPTAAIVEIKRFILEAVKAAGPDACPPFVLGVGIGGTADYAAFLAKKALLRKITTPHLRAGNLYHTRKSVVRLAGELLRTINRLNIGPMGLGGKTTCLGVNIETYPTHIAGLPVALNLSCHALRSASKTI
ncbi:MAG: fumarate hydratase [Candidatus Omnitrophota bacterium]